MVLQPSLGLSEFFVELFAGSFFPHEIDLKLYSLSTPVWGGGDEGLQAWRGASKMVRGPNKGTGVGGWIHLRADLHFCIWRAVRGKWLLKWPVLMGSHQEFPSP